MNISEIYAPARLQERLVRDCPPSLWIRGDPTFLVGSMIAIVGARACSSYGRSVARSWAREIADAGYVVVSGLARGIDGEAHRGALEASQGGTVAVLGCGIDRDYPATHAELARRMVEDNRGCIISEYEQGVEPAAWRFPSRNRIIAGLVEAMLVVEAREQSGALIAADFALAYGVPLYAIPGEVTSLLSFGTNDLIRRGVAKLCLEPQDILDALGT